MSQQIVLSTNITEAISPIINQLNFDNLFILGDNNSVKLCLPLLHNSVKKFNPHIITIEAGDQNKNLCSATKIWNELSRNKASRHSLMINLGGGMITDIGGFTSSTFKRGISFINIPTTLLAMVDAAIGGKTGINFDGLKNEIGLFADPLSTVISTQFLDSLTAEALFDGYAEIVKMLYMFAPGQVSYALSTDPLSLPRHELIKLIEFCVNKKKEITDNDKFETGDRKLLNFGHTAAHAFEALSQARNLPLSHGRAVAFGMLYALILSNLHFSLPSSFLYPHIEFLRKNYASLPFGCPDIDDLINIMTHDKKNLIAGQTSFVLINADGKPEKDIQIPTSTQKKAFELFNDLR